MRYISLNGYTPSTGWLKRAQQSLDEISGLPLDQRSEALKSKASVWQALKDELKSKSHDKCWYCESKRHRTDDAVDHYRPKAQVTENPTHEGYWWLAFDWHNYRFSCTYCNSRRSDANTSGGKQNHFPLINECKRACYPGDAICEEQPLLLDPLVRTDPGLLWFQEDGSAVARYPDRPILSNRANVSIDCYYLNYIQTVELRKELFISIRALVEDGNYYFDKYAEGDQLAYHALNRVVEQLQKLLDEDAEFSSAARCFLAGYRSCAWVQQLLDTCLA